MFPMFLTFFKSRQQWGFSLTKSFRLTFAQIALHINWRIDFWLPLRAFRNPLRARAYPEPLILRAYPVGGGKYGWTYRRTDGWTERRTDGWMEGRTDGRTNKNAYSWKQIVWFRLRDFWKPDDGSHLLIWKDTTMKIPRGKTMTEDSKSSSNTDIPSLDNGERWRRFKSAQDKLLIKKDPKRNRPKTKRQSDRLINREWERPSPENSR